MMCASPVAANIPHAPAPKRSDFICCSCEQINWKNTARQAIATNPRLRRNRIGAARPAIAAHPRLRRNRTCAGSPSALSPPCTLHEPRATTCTAYHLGFCNTCQRHPWTHRFSSPLSGRSTQAGVLAEQLPCVCPSPQKQQPQGA